MSLTVGRLIGKIRTDKKITRKRLAYGICSEHVLREIEEDKYAADVLMLDILMQRLGKSPDKFEIVLTKEAYYMVKLRDLVEETILRRKRDLAEKILQRYPSRTNTDKMYQHRMRASLLYNIDGNYKEAAMNLQKAISITLPDFSYDKMENYMISSMEMENFLALERMNMEENFDENSVREMTKSHLESCMDYINQHFEDNEEHAKLYSKCAWLLGGICYLEKDYVQVMVHCEKGIEGLRRNTILYFMLPLLELMANGQVSTEP